MTPSALNVARSAMFQVASVVESSLKQRISASDNMSSTIDIGPLMKMITLDVFGLWALSQDYGCCSALAPSRVFKLFEASLDDVTQGVKAMPWEFSQRNKQFMQNVQELRSVVMKAVEERKESKVRRDDLLQHLLDAKEKEGGSLDLDSSSAFVDVLLTVFFAGYDSTSITLAYAIYLISQHPEVEAKCLKEIETVQEWDDRVYCKAVITETLRLFPPAPVTARDVMKDVVMSDGTILPAGTKFFVPIWHIHRNDANFSRASEFIPERWVAPAISTTTTSESSAVQWVERDPTVDTTMEPIAAADPKSFFAFSGGGRNCAGSKFALMEASIVFQSLLKEFRFETLEGYEMRPKRHLMMQCPEDAVPMKISLRQ